MVLKPPVPQGGQDSPVPENPPPAQNPQDPAPLKIPLYQILLKHWQCPYVNIQLVPFQAQIFRKPDTDAEAHT